MSLKYKKTTRSRKVHTIYKKEIFIISLIFLSFATSTLYAGWLDDISKIKKIVAPAINKSSNNGKTRQQTTQEEQFKLAMQKIELAKKEKEKKRAAQLEQQRLATRKAYLARKELAKKEAALAEQRKIAHQKAYLARKRKNEEDYQRRLAKQQAYLANQKIYMPKYRQALLDNDKEKINEYKKHLLHENQKDVESKLSHEKSERENKIRKQIKEQRLIPIHNIIKERAKKLGYKKFKRGNIGALLYRSKIAPQYGGTGNIEINNSKGVVYLSDNMDSIITQNSRIEGYTQYIRNDANLVFLLKTKEPLTRGKGLDVTKGHVFIGWLAVKTIYGENQKLPVFEEI